MRRRIIPQAWLEAFTNGRELGHEIFSEQHMVVSLSTVGNMRIVDGPAWWREGGTSCGQSACFTVAALLLFLLRLPPGPNQGLVIGKQSSVTLFLLCKI
jgi:hypothetical protein